MRDILLEKGSGFQLLLFFNRVVILTKVSLVLGGHMGYTNVS